MAKKWQLLTEKSSGQVFVYLEQQLDGEPCANIGIEIINEGGATAQQRKAFANKLAKLLESSELFTS